LGEWASPLDFPPSPRPPSAAVAAAVAEGPAAARAGPGARCLGDASSRPTSAADDKAMALKLVGRGKGAWWIQAVAMEWLRTLAAARFPTATIRGRGVVIGSLDGASHLGDRGRTGQ
jgi:hypothetical protein